MSSFALSIASALVLGPALAGAAELRAARTSEPPVIDGRLDEPAWQAAPADAEFTQSFPDEGRAPGEPTEVRVLYDDRALYVGIRCHDAHPEAIVARLTRRDRDVDGDKVSVDVSSKNDRTSAYHFQVNAAGAELDGLRSNDTDLDLDWDGRWDSAVGRDAEGWTVEIAIPLATLRYPGGATSFGFQVRRQRALEIDEWAFIPSTAKGEVSYYGTLSGLDGLAADRPAQLLVYGSVQVGTRGTELNAGAGAKIGLTPGLTLDATLNPDFGTVEADPLVLNLSTFETYLPEKRPFFLEGADLFATPFHLFYSRRVGDQPHVPTLGPAEALVEPVPDTRIWGAVKLTGLLGDRLSIAALDALTAREDATIARTAGAPSEKRLVDSLSNFAVLRLRQDFAAASSVGVLATAVNRFEPAGAAAPRPGDLCPVPYTTAFTALVPPAPERGRCSHDGYTGGLDMRLRSAGGEWGASAQVVASLVESGPARRIPDGTVVGSGDTGAGILAEVGRYGGESFLARLGYSGSTPRLSLNDAGFQDQANFHDVTASLVWRTTHPFGAFQSAQLELWLEHKRDWALEDNLSTDVHLTGTIQLVELWTFSAELSPIYPRWVENRETQDGARTERIGGSYYAVEASSNPQAPAVLAMKGTLDSRLRGHAWHASATLSLRPFAALELELIPNLDLQNGAPRWIVTEPGLDGARTYFFGDLESTSFDLTVRGTYAFTRKLSLQVFAQPFWASGHAARITAATASGPRPFLALDSFADTTLPPGTSPDFSDAAVDLNVFLRWEYRPLSTLWLVYTRNAREDAVQLELAYLWF